MEARAAAERLHVLTPTPGVHKPHEQYEEGFLARNVASVAPLETLHELTNVSLAIKHEEMLALLVAELFKRTEAAWLVVVLAPGLVLRAQQA